MLAAPSWQVVALEEEYLWLVQCRGCQVVLAVMDFNGVQFCLSISWGISVLDNVLYQSFAAALVGLSTSERQLCTFLQSNVIQSEHMLLKLLCLHADDPGQKICRHP